MATTEPLAVLSGRYELEERLGQGGMAEVFAATDLRLGRPVAIKMLRAHLAADEVVKSRFEQEARTAARLSHPNVVSIYDTAEDDGTAYIVMERLPGTTFADELADGPTAPARARQVARQVLSALSAAHAVGIVHRDIKPANVLTCEDGRVKVADFGIATAMDEAHGITSTGLLVGTPAYLAPERLDGSPATAAADLYSVGALLYVALAGRQPFEGRNTLALIAAIREEEPEPLCSTRPDLDPSICRLVEQAMAKDPADRPPSAAAMAGLLGGRLSEGDTAEFATGPGATQVLPQPGPSRQKTRRLPSRAEVEELATPALATARRYRIPLIFVGAVLLALAIALPLAAAGPSLPAPPAKARPSVTSPAKRYPPVRNVPSQFQKAMTNLEQAVG